MSFTIRANCPCERCAAGRGEGLGLNLNPPVCPECHSQYCPHAHDHGLLCLEDALDRRPNRIDRKWEPPRMHVRRQPANAR